VSQREEVRTARALESIAVTLKDILESMLRQEAAKLNEKEK
jgi:hypothetical protein